MLHHHYVGWVQVSTASPTHLPSITVPPCVCPVLGKTAQLITIPSPAWAIEWEGVGVEFYMYFSFPCLWLIGDKVKVQNIQDSIGVGKGPDPRVPMKEFIDYGLSVVRWYSGLHTATEEVSERTM